MTYKKGDKVLFVNDTNKATVIEVFPDGRVKVEDENGFDYIVKGNELMKEHPAFSKAIDRIDEYDISIAAAKDQVKRSKLQLEAISAPAFVKHGPDVLEVDLHIENLVDHPKKLSNGEIVEIQLRMFERMLQKAIEQKKRRAIFIHGVGQGVLRAEIRQLLEFYPNVDFHDASYQLYGYGATEVIIRQRAF